MPWTSSDAKRFKKGLSPKQARQWAHIANSTLSDCLDKGGERSKCEGKAVRVANGSVGAPKRKEVEMTDENIEQIEPQEETKEQKMYDAPMTQYVPSNVTTFAGYEENLRQQEKTYEIISDAVVFKELALNIAFSEEIKDKDAAMTALASEFAERVKNPEDHMDAEHKEIESKSPAKKNRLLGLVDELSAAIKSKFINESEQETSDVSLNFFIWKEGTRDRFLVRYSNNFRDDDNPPEIISAASHQNFVRLVENKEAAMPELWLWHRPEWRLGDCDMVAYDESGFAIASGLIDVGKEKAAEQAAEQNFICSHGMPKSSIERDPVDPSVITKHITTEISLLPQYAAANKLTGYILLGSDNKEEEPMAIPAEKRAALEKRGFDPALLDKLEAMNKEDAAKALDEGREYKEKDAEAADTLDESAVSEQVAEETPAQDAAQEASEETPAPVYPTIQEVASAFESVITPVLDRVGALESQIEEMSKQIRDTQQDEEEKVKDRIEHIPPASLASLLASKFSAVGQKETQIDGRSSLAKSAPKETEAQDDNERSSFFIPFIRDMVSASTPEE